MVMMMMMMMIIVIIMIINIVADPSRRLPAFLRDSDR